MTWISVLDRMPEPVTGEDGKRSANSTWAFVVVKDLGDGRRWADSSYYSFACGRWVHEQAKLAGISVTLRVTHWMPMPELPEE